MILCLSHTKPRTAASIGQCRQAIYHHMPRCISAARRDLTHTAKIEAGRFGVVEMEGQNITSFEEHPKNPKSNLAAVFIGFLKPEIFDNIPPGNVRWSLQENIFPKLAKEGNMCGYPVPGNWINIHDPSDIEKVREL